MASSPDFVEFVCSQISGTGNIRYRKMFGEYMVYVNDKPVILICDDIPYVRMIPEIEEMMDGAETGFPYKGAHERYILDVSRRTEAAAVVSVLERVLPYPKAKKKKREVRG